MFSGFLSKIFDDEGVDTFSYAMTYIVLWVILFLAFMYIGDHLKMFKGQIYEFPIDPAREPLPKEETN